MDAERRLLERLEPRAQLAASRERVGLLLDRAARVADGRLARSARDVELSAGRLARTLPDRLAREVRTVDVLGARAPRVAQARLASARAGLDSAATALGVLGPHATLERGYAIVRAAGSGAILRDPGDAPAGMPLAIDLAHGTLAATSDGVPAAAADPGGG
jgi:exodeoxyribonuclease VII large subunit